MTQLLSPAASRPRWRSALATLALVGALFATTSAAPAVAAAAAGDIPPGPGVISGNVTMSDGQPAVGVLLNASVSFGEGTAFSAHAYTDVNGHYDLTGLPLDYTLVVNAHLWGYLAPAYQFVTLSAASPTGTANFVIEPFPTGAGTISGHVTGDGVPLAGQEVRASNTQTFQTVYASSDGEGYFQFTGLANGHWNVNAFVGQQYQSLIPVSVVLTDSAPTATTNLAFLSWPVGTASISGVVTDSATGLPIAGVNISVSGIDVPHNSNVYGNDNGTYSIDQLPEGTYSLSFFAPGYLLIYEVQAHVSSGQALTLDRTLVAANATITGHVKRSDGAPAQDVVVYAIGADTNWNSAITDAGGDYTIADLGAGKYTVRVGGVGTAFEQQEKIVTAVANSDVTANFTLANRTTGSLVGTVFQPGGEFYTKPICATLYSSKNKKAVAEKYIDGEHYGSDEFLFENLKPGKYTVEIRDCDKDPATKFDKVFLGGMKTYKDATFVTIAAAQDSWGNDIVVAPSSR